MYIYILQNKANMHQFGDKTNLYYDARSEKHQIKNIILN
jgi:hypothetical protein